MPVMGVIEVIGRLAMIRCRELLELCRQARVVYR